MSIAPRGPGERGLLEREGELDEITASVERAAAGRGSLAAILGPPGVGKTSLLDEARRSAAARGLTCLHAACAELESSIPFGVVRGLFERRIAGLAEAERAALMSGAARLAAPALSLAGEFERPVPADAGFAALHGLYWLSANLAQASPLLLSVDDAHWADAASLRFLAYLVPRLEELPIALLIASRPPAPPAARTEALEALLSNPATALVAPRPLSEPAVAALLEARLAVEPAAVFTRGVHTATGGNPFLATSLIATLLEEGVDPTAAAAAELERLTPEAITRSVRHRLRRLPATLASVADAVAVLGPAVQLRDAARLAGLPTRAAAGAADALAQQGILRPGRPLEFVHPIVRRAIADSLAHGERAASHSSAARMLARDGAPAERVATHLLAADPAGDGRVVEQLRAAAAAAISRGAPEAAVDYLRRAAGEPPPVAVRPHLLWELGRAGRIVGDPAGTRHLREALATMRAPADRARIARELTRALLPAGRFEEAVTTLEHAIAKLGGDDRELALELEAELATAGRLDPGTQPRTAPRLERIGSGIEGGSPAERLVIASLGFQRALAGGFADWAAGLVEVALDRGLLAEQGSDSPALADAHTTLIMAERFNRVERALGEALEQARRRASLSGIAVTSMFRSMLAQRRGEPIVAESEARTAVDAAAAAGWIALELMARACVVEALIDRGQPAAALSALSAHAADEIPDNLMLNFLLHARARARVANGDLEAGIADLVALGRRERALGWDNPARFAWRSQAAEALIRLGDGERARRLAGDELSRARNWGTPRAIGVALRAVGLATSGGECVVPLREAVETLAPSGARLEHARALVDLGAALRRSGSRSEARDPLAEGMELAHHCGAGDLLERAHVELRAAGARPRRIVRTGVDALTASELRTARMAADGMTNREIAQALFVTARTIESHLTGAYRKLDIASREELRGRLAIEN